MQNNARVFSIILKFVYFLKYYHVFVKNVKKKTANLYNFHMKLNIVVNMPQKRKINLYI